MRHRRGEGPQSRPPSPREGGAADDHDWESLRQRVLGLGERSMRKSHYPELQRRIHELDRFKTLLDHSSDVILLLDAERGDILDANLTACQSLGVSQGALSHERLQDFLPAEAWQQLVEHVRQRRLGESHRFRTELLPRGRAAIAVEINVDLHQAQERLLAVAVARDITAALAYEAALRDKEALYRAAVESFDGMIVVADPTGKVVLANRKTSERCGDGSSGRKCYDLLLDSEAPCVHCDLGGPREESVREVERARDGRWYLMSSTPIARADGRYARQCALLDITERRAAEQRQRNLEQKLQHAQRLESLGALAGGVAHDFNNLLLGILGNVELMGIEDGTYRVEPQLVEGVRTAAMGMADLTRQLLAAAGKGPAPRQRQDVCRAVEEMVPVIRMSVSGNADIQIDLQDPLPAVEADLGLLQQVLLNLVTNAAESLSGAAGTVAIRASLARLDAEELGDVTGGLTPGEYVCLEVKDSGFGMAQDVVNRVFEPFFSTKGTGRGLGLATVDGILRRHGGGVRVRSEVGQGSSVAVFLPPANDQPAKDRGVVAQSRGTSLRGTTVLLIDDDDEVRITAERMLQKLGCRVLVAAGGQEGTDLFTAHADAVDAVLVDYAMPGMDGRATARAIKSVREDAAVVLMSGYGDEAGDSSDTVGGPVDAFLGKPFTLETLAECVGGLASGGTSGRDGARR